MYINIELTKTVYINLKKDYQKNNEMLQMLSSFINVKRQPGIDDSQGCRSVTKRIGMAHSEAILNNYLENPLIILEDDCKKFYYRKYINIPEDADLIFLGSWEQANIQKFDDEVSRVFDIRGAHAILYNSERGKTFMLEKIQESIDENLWHDHVFGTQIKEINAYVLNLPIFYQTSKIKETKITYNIT